MLNKTGFSFYVLVFAVLPNQSAWSAIHLHVAIFALRKDGFAKLKAVDLVAQAVCDVAVGAADEWRLRIGHFVVFVIVEPRFVERVLVAFNARFILNWDDNDGWLSRDLRIILERVPACERKDLGAPRDPFAAMTFDALDIFFAMVERGKVLCVALRDSTRKSRKILGFRLRVT